MPVCFDLTPRADPGHGPMMLQDIDKVLCDALGQPCHPKYWLVGWYDYIGFRLAVGSTFDKLIAEFQDYLVKDAKSGDESFKKTALLLACAIYLRDNFISNAWREAK